PCPASLPTRRSSDLEVMIMSVRTVDPKTKIVSETYVGAVLAEYEDNGYHDSYGHAIVWDATTASVRTVATWSTAYYSLTAADTEDRKSTRLNSSHVK